MNVIYTFWTGTNPISDTRKECLKQLEAVSSQKIILVTKIIHKALFCFTKGFISIIPDKLILKAMNSPTYMSG